ncbi:hypothetical protein R1flu_000180 [Riccia fluitans]|uniref:Uncharacterized protein n=1 Tax=Riccia fluitans TaxID=41844 RepID=A0ABD1XZR4_9MARC
METIDRLVQGEEANSKDGAIVEKIPTLQSMAIQHVVPTQLPRPRTINFEELSLLTRDEVFPHLKFDHLKTEGILFIDGSVFAREAEFLRRTSHKSLKDAWTAIARWFNYRNAQPRNEGWFIDQLVFFSSQGREDDKLVDLSAKLVIRQALKWIGRPSSSYTSTTLVLLALAEVDPGEPNLKLDCCPAHPHIVPRLNGEAEPRANPLLLGDEPRNAFGDTQAQWGAERCKLVCERDQLKEDLHKAQGVLADAAQREEALRAEHKRL